jgi:hypothetical protein
MSMFTTLTTGETLGDGFTVVDDLAALNGDYVAELGYADDVDDSLDDALVGATLPTALGLTESLRALTAAVKAGGPDAVVGLADGIWVLCAPDAVQEPYTGSRPQARAVKALTGAVVAAVAEAETVEQQLGLLAAAARMHEVLASSPTAARRGFDEPLAGIADAIIGSVYPVKPERGVDRDLLQSERDLPGLGKDLLGRKPGKPRRRKAPATRAKAPQAKAGTRRRRGQGRSAQGNGNQAKAPQAKAGTRRPRRRNRKPAQA